MISESRLEHLRRIFKDQEDLYLLFFWVGPVQEFIQEARKVRDLWMGSYLLAKATFEAMQPCLDNAHCEILLPDVHDSPLYKSRQGCLTEPDSLAYSSLPNHFIALTTAQNVKDITEGVRCCLNRFLPSLASKIKGELEARVDMNGAGLWEFQVQDHFQLMWVGFPIKFEELESTDKYGERFNDLQRLMQERKLTRTFEAWRGVPVDKCSQCGRREVLTPAPPPVTRQQLRDFWNSIRNTNIASHRIRDTERLCAVCLVKRLVRARDLDPALVLEQFESTSDIASRPFKKTLADSKRGTEVQGFLDRVQSLARVVGTGFGPIKDITDIPGDWLYEEGLLYERLRREHSVPDSASAKVKEAAEEAREALLSLYATRGQKPSKHYAIVILDADEIGKYMAGKKMPPGKTFSLDWQYEQSQILSELANTEFISTVEKHDGQTIYSGGDDLLAFGPLESVFREVEELRTRFTARIKTTTSAAVVIVHHHDPLQWAIREARQALERAKETYRRDSIVISVRLSSGNYLTCGSHWDLRPDGSSSEVSFLNGFLSPLVQWMSTGEKGLSTAFVNDLVSEIGAFYRDGKLSADMLQLEIERLFERHLPNDSPIRTCNNKDVIEAVRKSLVHLGDPRKQDFEGSSMENVTCILGLAAFLAKEATEEGR